MFAKYNVASMNLCTTLIQNERCLIHDSSILRSCSVEVSLFLAFMTFIVKPHQSENESDFAREIAAKRVLYPIASDVASEITFAWCGR